MASISNLTRSAYDIAFQVTPIILNGGIASQALGGMLPIIALTGQLAAFSQGVVTNGLSLDDFYARFINIPGGTVINNAIGTYPFANQQVAANAIIEQPLNISLEMISPVNTTGGYLTKLALFTALRNAVQAHNQAGGTYHIATPAFLYTNCIMAAITDITNEGETAQKQVRWQFDFVRPLVSESDALAIAGALNSKMKQIANGLKLTNASNSGPQPATGSPAQGALQSIGNMAGVVNKFLSAPI